VLDGRVRARAAAVCGALVLVLTACGSLGTGTGSPRSTGDLFSALPGTVSAIPAPPSASQDDKARSAVPNDPGPEWKRVTAEDFDSFRSDAYGTYDSVGAFGNGLRRSSAISVSGGALNITARNGNVSGGMAHKLDRTYGRWEFRARTDKGRGFGSAILLWPESERFPQDGEIDIMEVPSETRDRAHFIVHFAGPGGSDKVYGSYAEDDFSQWHTFAVDWLPDRIVYYVDGVERFRVTDRNIIPDKPMHLAMQFDQGPKKDWIPAPDATTPPAFSLQVDWLRVYAPAFRS
jgi:beta-glucanase (GH16 family)